MSLELDLEKLPPNLLEKLCQLAEKMGCSEEELASKMVSLILNQCKSSCEQPSEELRQFLEEARRALNDPFA